MFPFARNSHSLSLTEAKFSKTRISQDHLGAVGRGINKYFTRSVAYGKGGVIRCISRDHLIVKNRNPLKLI